MGFDVFLQVILAAERFLANGTRERSQSRVDSPMSCEFFVTCERLTASVVVTGERTFAGVNANVRLELAVVRETDVTMGTVELFRPLHRRSLQFGGGIDAGGQHDGTVEFG